MWQKPQQQKQQVCSAAKVIFGFLSTNPTWAPGLCILLLGWAAVQFALVAFQRKNLSLENALGCFRGEARAFRSPGSHSEDTLRIKSMLKMLQLLPTHKTPWEWLCFSQWLTLTFQLTEKNIPGSEQPLWLRNWATVKLKLHPAHRTGGTWRFLDCRKKSGLQIKYSKVFPKVLN